MISDENYKNLKMRWEKVDNNQNAVENASILQNLLVAFILRVISMHSHIISHLVFM